MKRNTAQLKEQLIQTGIDEIGKHGLNSSLRTVAKACCVTHGTPYRHFESKEGYLKVVLAFRCFSIRKMKILTRQVLRDQLTQLGFNSLFCQDLSSFF